MSIAKVLVPLRGDGKGEQVLSHAAALARRFNAHISALHSRARPEDMLPYGVPVPRGMRETMAAQAQMLADEEEAHLRQMFDGLMGQYGFEVVADLPPPRDRPTASWHEAMGKQIETIRDHGRLADLVAVAKPDRDRNLGANTLKSALYATGRPVLMCPEAAAPAALGERIAIAWNGSTEAARAVALAMDVIREATTVHILVIGEEKQSQADAESLADYLAFRGLQADIQRGAERSSIGAQLLAMSAEAGADLLVMGAYSHSRAQETVFGGVTQHIVDNAKIPSLLVH